LAALDKHNGGENYQELFDETLASATSRNIDKMTAVLKKYGLGKNLHIGYHRGSAKKSWT